MIELRIGENFGNRLTVLILRPEGPVGSVGRDIAKERFFLLGRFANETLGLIEEDVGAIALELFFLSVVDVNIVEIVVPPIGGNRRDGGGGIPDAFLKATILRSVGIVSPEVPLPKDTGGITRVGKVIGHGRVLGPKQGPSAAHVDGPVTGRVQPGKQLPAGGRAHG